jgi:hypothetical protein
MRAYKRKNGHNISSVELSPVAETRTKNYYRIIG